MSVEVESTKRNAPPPLFHSRVYPSPALRRWDSKYGDKEYSVLRLLGKREHKKYGLQFLVRWRGVDPDTKKPDDDSWQADEQISEDLKQPGVLRAHRDVGGEVG